MFRRFLFSAGLLLASNVFAQERWVGTWSAAPQAPQAPRAAQPPQVPQVQGPIVVGTNGQSQTVATIQITPSMLPGGQTAPAAPPSAAPPAPTQFSNQTVRMVVRTSIGGRRARVQLANTYGATPLTIGAASIALRAKGSEIVAGSSKPVTYNGKTSFWIPAGASLLSDPFDFNVPANGDVAISIYLPGETPISTLHSVGLHSTYVSRSGNQVADLSVDPVQTTRSWYFLSGLEVMAPASTVAIVTVGDSITDGTRSTPDTDNSWPSNLSRRLQAAGASIAVLNQGISGNRILRDIAGSNALARFDRDVLGLNGVKWLVLLEGINDIGNGNRDTTPPGERVVADEVIAGMKQLIDRAHSHGIQVVGATLTPFEGAGYYNAVAENARETVNQWIRTSGAFDAVVDFDAAIRDPASPKKFAAEFDSGDHLHPGDAGYKAMANAFNLAIFGVKN